MPGRSWSRSPRVGRALGVRWTLLCVFHHRHFICRWHRTHRPRLSGTGLPDLWFVRQEAPMEAVSVARGGSSARMWPFSYGADFPWMGGLVVSRSHARGPGTIRWTEGEFRGDSNGWLSHLLTHGKRPEDVKLVKAVLTFHGDEQQAIQEEFLPPPFGAGDIGLVRPAPRAFHRVTLSSSSGVLRPGQRFPRCSTRTDRVGPPKSVCHKETYWARDTRRVDT